MGCRARRGRRTDVLIARGTLVDAANEPDAQARPTVPLPRPQGARSSSGCPWGRRCTKIYARARRACAGPFRFAPDAPIHARDLAWPARHARPSRARRGGTPRRVAKTLSHGGRVSRVGRSDSAVGWGVPAQLFRGSDHAPGRSHFSQRRGGVASRAPTPDPLQSCDTPAASLWTDAGDYLMWRLMPRSRSGHKTTASSADTRGLRVPACVK